MYVTEKKKKKKGKKKRKQASSLSRLEILSSSLLIQAKSITDMGPRHESSWSAPAASVVSFSRTSS